MLKPRFCIKGGLVDWSASPNATTLELQAERPFDGQSLTAGALRQVVHLHAMWKVSGGEKGARADLRGAVLTKDARDVIAHKLSEPGADLWAEVVASSAG